jgi:hypothetical protein
MAGTIKGCSCIDISFKAYTIAMSFENMQSRKDITVIRDESISNMAVLNMIWS